MAQTSTQGFVRWRAAPILDFVVGTNKSVLLTKSISNPKHVAVTYKVKTGSLPAGCTPTGGVGTVIPNATVFWSGSGSPGSTPVTFDVIETVGGYIATSPQASVNITGAVTPMPTVPTGVTVMALSSTALRISWTPSAGGSTITQYRVYRSATSGGTYSQVGTTTAPTITFDNTTGLVANTTYWYRVAAFDGTNLSGQSTSGSGTTLTSAGPAVPQNVSVSTVSSTTLRVSWIPGSGGSPAISYNVLRSSTSGSGFTQISSDVAATDSFSGTVNTALPSYNAAWLTPSGGQTCEIGLNSTFRGSGLQASVNYRNLSFASAHYSRVRLVNPVQTSFASCGPAVRVQAGAESYYYAQYGKPNVYVGQRIAGVATDWETVTGFVDGDTIELAIDPSVLTTVYLKRNGTTIRTYTGKGALSGGRSGVVAFNGQGTEGEGSAGNWAGGNTNSAGPYDDTSLSAGQTRYYKVEAVDANAAVSSPSAEASGTTSGALTPTMPINVAATGINTSTIRVTWANGAGGSAVTANKIYRASSSAGPWTTALAIDNDGSPYDNTGLAAGATWFYKVSALDASLQESGLSTTVSATTTAASYSLNVAWTPATQNSDGSAIGTILSHKIYAGQSSGNYTQFRTAAWPATSYALTGLPSGGTWYVMVTTVTNAGESVASVEASRAANVS